MSVIEFNKKLSSDMYLMKVKEKNDSKMGQFYMLRAWDTYPVLSRPISIYDSDSESVTFLYKTVGKGTEYFATLKEGDEITLEGPHGNGFPLLKGKIALVGGGVGIAPLYLTAKKLKEFGNTVDIYLGFSGETVLTDEYEKICDNLKVNVGGYVTDDITPAEYDAIFTCGPDIMMRILTEKAAKEAPDVPVYVSMENRMACGYGVCLCCSVNTEKGNMRACKEGPVFQGKEVYR